MAYSGKIIVNTQTGQQLHFLKTRRDTGGQLLEMEATYRAFSPEPPPHYHPFQEEEFEVLAGEMTVRIDGATRILKTGDTLHIPPDTVHSMWNHGDQPATVNWKVRPALDTEYFFETATGLANDGRTDPGGRPNFWQGVVLLHRFSPVFRLVKPPYFVQRVLFGILAMAGRVLGYRGVYKAYID